MAIVLEKWHLAENGSITAWLMHTEHVSSKYTVLKKCYTGKTNSSHVYGTVDGRSVVAGVSIIYEYTIPLTQLKKRDVKWHWEGKYNDLVIEFNIEQHCQETSEDNKQTLKQINDIIAKLNEPPKAKYQPHNFRLSEDIVLCQHCGEFLSELKKTNFPACLGNNL